MNVIARTIATLSLVSTLWAQPDVATRKEETRPMRIFSDSKTVSPALDKYAQGTLAGLWKRPDLEPRDRSIVTLGALIARNQTFEMAQYMNLALDNGVKAREVSEIITHLAFYAGWANAASAVAVAKDVFAARKIGADQLPAASPQQLLPLNEEAEESRAAPFNSSMVPWLPASCNTPRTFCSATFGSAPIWRPATGVW
jgi:4-carboxymuconolactone decarboxylase